MTFQEHRSQLLFRKFTNNFDVELGYVVAEPVDGAADVLSGGWKAVCLKGIHLVLREDPRGLCRWGPFVEGSCVGAREVYSVPKVHKVTSAVVHSVMQRCCIDWNQTQEEYSDRDSKT